MSTVRLSHIAKEASLSVASVSRALMNDPMISEPTRNRVWEISQRLGYEGRRQRLRRDRFGYARAAFVMVLPRGASRTDDISSGQMAWCAKSRRLRLDLHHVDPGDDDAMTASLLEIAGHGDALLIYGRATAGVLARLAERGVRAVVLGNPEGGVREQPRAVVVTSDFVEMGRCATQRLLDAGHRRIAFVTGTREPGMFVDCWLTGFKLAHVLAGVPVHDDLIVQFPPSSPGLPLPPIGQLIAALTSEPPSGYVFADASVAFAVLEGLAAQGIEVAPAQVTFGNRESRVVMSSERRRWPMVLEDSDAMIESAMAQLRLAIDSGPQRPVTILVPFHTVNFDVR